MIEAEKKLLGSKSRELLRHREILDYAMQEVEVGLSSPIDKETAFLTAKETIRRESIKEGMRLLLGKLNKYSQHG